MRMAASKKTESRYGRPWNREELILAFDLYCRIPFQRTKASNPRVQELAALLGRTPAAVARKLGNFGAFDPELQRRGISGLVHFGRLDKEIWEEFHQNWNSLVLEAEKLREQLSEKQIELEQLVSPNGASEALRETKARLHQRFFREAVLSSYNEVCCITGLSIPECLIAGHIVPWSVDETRRADPRNGLCLSATFDRLFDKGLLTVGPNMRVIMSGSLVDRKDEAIQHQVACFHNQEIRLPSRFLPSEDCLEWHRRNVFRP